MILQSLAANRFTLVLRARKSLFLRASWLRCSRAAIRAKKASVRSSFFVFFAIPLTPIALLQRERRVAELEEVLADKRRLAREIDIALHGEEGTAKQASLCDLVHPARQLRLERDQAKTALKACLPWVIGASEQITDAARAVIKQGEMPWLLSRHAPGDFE